VNEPLKKFLNDRNLKGIGDIKWAHAVNNTKYLEQALNNADVHFIEVDISLSKELKPIAAHYNDGSDLAFEQLLNLVKQSDKGLKFDLKDQKTVLPCLQKLKSSKLGRPIVLNADILSLADTPPAIIAGKKFINDCREFYPDGLLSVGWRTNYDSTYTSEDINKMLQLCRNIKEVSFPIRASILPRSWENVKKLLENDAYTLTIWNSEPLDDDLKKWIEQNTDPKKCFYDFTASKHDGGIS
jgi:glycerophosphoryl diester phosphodiesterase